MGYILLCKRRIMALGGVYIHISHIYSWMLNLIMYDIYYDHQMMYGIYMYQQNYN